MTPNPWVWGHWYLRHIDPLVAQIPSLKILLNKSLQCRDAACSTYHGQCMRQDSVTLSAPIISRHCVVSILPSRDLPAIFHRASDVFSDRIHNLALCYIHIPIQELETEDSGNLITTKKYQWAIPKITYFFQFEHIENSGQFWAFKKIWQVCKICY